MKKAVPVLAAVVLVVALAACSASKEKPQSVFDKIRESSVALMESSEGAKVYVWNMQDLASLSSLQMEEAPLEPADQEGDWLYRITYNPKDKAPNSEEIIVSFHREYLQIGSEFYLPKQDGKYGDLLDWAASKFEYLAKTYSAEQEKTIPG